jgi:hypothetical protein
MWHEQASESANEKGITQVGSRAANSIHGGVGGGIGAAGVKASGPSGATLRAGLDPGSRGDLERFDPGSSQPEARTRSHVHTRDQIVP